MSKNQTEEILNAIKTDNLASFSNCVSAKENLSICYGKFPVLSLCYLYKSKNIIKRFERELLNITKYSKRSDDFASYILFRKNAKKSLRLYSATDKIVSPLEMLALLGENEYLKKVYPFASKTDAVLENLNRIFEINFNAKIQQKSNAISIPRFPLGNTKKTFFILAIVICCIMLAFSSVTWAYAQNKFGGGFGANDFIKISSEVQLVSAIANGKDKFSLTKDIELSQNWTAKDFDGVLNGNGHTIKVGDKMQGGFLLQNKGKIQNIKFEFGAQNADIVGDKSLFVVKNQGIVDNVFIKIVGEFRDSSKQEELFLSVFSLENKGTIKNSKLDCNVKMLGDGEGNAYLSGFSARNEGKIVGCGILSGSVLQTDTVDVAGFAAVNLAKGSIDSCANNADISQTTENPGWSPNTSGIALSNDGVISNCVNNGKIKTESTVLIGAEAHQRPVAYVGGIVNVNAGTLKKCKNNGEITAKTKDVTIYLGGVVSVNSNEKSVVDNCCSYGQLNILSNEPITIEEDYYDHFVFGGGIVGVSSGDIKNCFSVSTFDTNVKELVFIGGIFGQANIVSAKSFNNYYMDAKNIKFGGATILYGSSIIFYTEENFKSIEELFLSNCERVYYLEQLKQKEVYWE